MPSRILKESILDSPTLAKLDEFVQDQFPRLLLLVDDWGCFNADPDSIKGKAYPKRPKVTINVIDKILKGFHDSGMLFLWLDGDRTYGFWTGWDDHNYCNGSAVEEDGKQAKHRRKTPEPPQDLLAQYVSHFKNKLEQPRTKFSIPIPIPIPIPIHGLEEVEEAQRPTPELMLKIYDRERGPLLECRKLTDERRKRCLSRISERAKDPKQFLQDFTLSIVRARGSPFMTGGGDRGWVADLDFFIRNDKNYIRILEGRYDGRAKSKAEQRRDRLNGAVQGYLSDVDEGIRGDNADA